MVALPVVRGCILALPIGAYVGAYVLVYVPCSPARPLKLLGLAGKEYVVYPGTIGCPLFFTFYTVLHS